MLVLRLLGDAAAATLSTLACVEHAGPDLIDHAVPVVVDTAAWIDAGELDPDCADLRVTDLAGDPLPFWVEDATCDTGATTVWVGLSAVPAGTTDVVLVRSDVPVGAPGDGSTVFPLFEDFSDPAGFPGGRWIFRGGNAGDVSVSDGVLDSVDQPLAMYSVATAFQADSTELVVRMDATGGWDDDLEIGGGGISAVGSLWREDRDWFGFTHLSWEGAYYSVSDGTSPSQSCLDQAFDGQPWLPVVDQDPRGWVRAEVRYDSVGGSTLTLDEATVITRVGSAACVPEPALPVLVVFDHSAGGSNPSQTLDFLLVRPTADPEPTAAVVEDDPDLDGVPSAVEGCGDDDGDGAPNWDDPPDPPEDTGSVDTGTVDTGTPSGTGAGGSGTAPPTGGPGTDVVDTGGVATGAPGDRSPAGNDGAAVGCGCQAGASADPVGALAVGLLLGCRRRRAG